MIYKNVMVLNKFQRHAEKRGLQDNAERWAREMTPAFMGNMPVVIDNLKILDGTGLGSRAHSVFCRMQPDVDSVPTLAAIKVMDSLPRAELDDGSMRASVPSISGGTSSTLML